LGLNAPVRAFEYDAVGFKVLCVRKAAKKGR
jgi:hypothetical protein